VKPRGFTLLEMMIAMAILSGALTWLVMGMSRNIQAENHAKLLSTATFLARGKMVEFEDELFLKGFSEFTSEPPCDLDKKNFPRFTCKIVVDKVELPSAEQIQTVLTKAQEANSTLGGSDDKKPPPASGKSSAAGSPMSMGAGALASQFGIIKDVLEQGIRRITVQILWNEGRVKRDLSLVAYYTDVRKVDQAIQIAAQPPGATGGTGPTSTTQPTTPPVKP
jgi:general secretion pathway protein I